MSIYHERLRKIRQAMAERGIELAFFPPSPYMFFATGIRHPHFAVMRVPGDWLSGMFIGLDKGPIFVAHWMLMRHVAIGEAVTGSRVLEQGQDPFGLLKSVLSGFDLHHRRVAVGDHAWARTVEAIRAALPDAQISMASEFMDGLLAVKDEEALARIRAVAKMTDRVYEEVVKHLRVGVTERDVVVEVDYQFRKLGAEENSFATGVVFSRPGDDPPTPGKRLQPGDSVTFDFGGVYQGYSSDFGRSAFVGDPPPEYLKVHETVLRAQAAAMKAMKAGNLTCEEADAIARGVIADAGYGPNFTHRLGHGIGITVHERPFLDEGEKDVLQAGMTFTVEPSIRVAGRFANRVEDVVLVTDEGGEYLNAASRDLYIVD